MQEKEAGALNHMREQVRIYIDSSYETVEQFCWDRGVNKATISNFLRGKNDFRISTLVQIAEACEMELEIHLKKSCSSE